MQAEQRVPACEQTCSGAESDAAQQRPRGGKCIHLCLNAFYSLIRSVFNNPENKSVDHKTHRRFKRNNLFPKCQTFPALGRIMSILTFLVAKLAENKKLICSRRWPSLIKTSTIFYNLLIFCLTNSKSSLSEGYSLFLESVKSG